MFSIDVPFFEATPRDLSSPLIQPIQRRFFINQGGIGYSVDFDVPIDFVFQIQRVQMTGVPIAGENFVFASLDLTDVGAALPLGSIWSVRSQGAFGLVGDNSSPPAAAGTTVSLNVPFENIFIAPRVKLTLTMEKAAGQLGNASYFYSLWGVLVPKGNIPRY